MRKVTKVATQGRPGSNDYVETYKLSFSLDGNSFEFHREVRQKVKGKAATTTSSHHMQLFSCKTWDSDLQSCASTFFKVIAFLISWFPLQVFQGNKDGDSTNTNRVLPPFHARYVRVYPQSWNVRICMRLELYGCESTGKDEGNLAS